MKSGKHKTKGKHMDDKAKIDLTDVNKKQKSSVKLSNLKVLKKQKGPKRDEEGKFTAGSGGLTTAKQFNWKRAAPLITIVTIVGGFFVYQSFAATGRGGPENHNGSRGCTNLPAQYVVPYEKRSYLGRNIGEGMVRALYKQYHGKVPTKDELIYWVTTRNSELKQQYGENCVAISYIGNLEIRALKTFGIDSKFQEDKAAQGADVVHRVYASDIKRPGSVATVATTRAGTSGLPVIPVGGTGIIDAYTAHAGTWKSDWPAKYKSCAIVYRDGLSSAVRSGSVKDIVTFNNKNYDLSTQKNIGTSSVTTETGADGRVRTVYNLEKYELCSDYQSAPVARTVGSKTRPATYSFNLQLSSDKQSRILLESYSIKK